MNPPSPKPAHQHERETVEQKEELPSRESKPYSYVMWVSCEDRMPTGDGRYLVISDGLVGIGYWFCDEDGPGLRHEANYRWPSKITHWMAIPQTPSQPTPAQSTPSSPLIQTFSQTPSFDELKSQVAALTEERDRFKAANNQSQTILKQALRELGDLRAQMLKKVSDAAVEGAKIAVDALATEVKGRRVEGWAYIFLGDHHFSIMPFGNHLADQKRATLIVYDEGAEVKEIK